MSEEELSLIWKGCWFDAICESVTIMDLENVELGKVVGVFLLYLVTFLLLINDWVIVLAVWIWLLWLIVVRFSNCGELMDFCIFLLLTMLEEIEL